MSYTESESNCKFLGIRTYFLALSLLGMADSCPTIDSHLRFYCRTNNSSNKKKHLITIYGFIDVLKYNGINIQLFSQWQIWGSCYSTVNVKAPNKGNGDWDNTLQNLSSATALRKAYKLSRNVVGSTNTLCRLFELELLLTVF